MTPCGVAREGYAWGCIRAIGAIASLFSHSSFRRRRRGRGRPHPESRRFPHIRNGWATQMSFVIMGQASWAAHSTPYPVWVWAGGGDSCHRPHRPPQGPRLARAARPLPDQAHRPAGEDRPLPQLYPKCALYCPTPPTAAIISHIDDNCLRLRNIKRTTAFPTSARYLATTKTDALLNEKLNTYTDGCNKVAELSQHNPASRLHYHQVQPYQSWHQSRPQPQVTHHQHQSHGQPTHPHRGQPRRHKHGPAPPTLQTFPTAPRSSACPPTRLPSTHCRRCRHHQLLQR